MSSIPDPEHGAAQAFEALYRAWFRPVVRWLPAMGVMRGDVEDVAQEVFLVAQRKISTFDGENAGGWLYAMSLRVASNHRRLAWVKRLFLSEHAPEPEPSDSAETPESIVSQQQWLGLGEEVLAGLSDKLRRVFVLFELEGYSGEEIAALEKIPVATVWTRLHNARKQFEEHATRERRKRGLP